MSKIIIERDDYRDSPVLSIKNEGDKFPFTFGIGKAKLLLQALKEQPDLLERFIAEVKKC